MLEATSPLHRDILLKALEDHPDKTFYDRIKEYSDKGVPVGYTGDRHYQEFPNWPSAYRYKNAVSACIARDIDMGRKLGPFHSPPFTTFMGSPLGAFPKKRSCGKYRVIQDLSWPPGRSVNSCIPDDECTLHYISIDAAVSMVKKYGIGSNISKLDLEDAFKCIIVRPEDWDLLGSVWCDDNNIKHYYVDTVLTFGLRSSPRRFNDFADALQYVMLKDGVTDVCHYLDDYLTVGAPDSTQCGTNLDIMLNTCSRLGFTVNPNKLVYPNTEMEFLGIIVDTVRSELRISNDRIQEIMQELTQWGKRRKCTKRNLLSIIGKLAFVSRVVKPGRTFVARMIQLAKTVKHLHHRISLNSGFRSDVIWWERYLTSWNGVSIFYDEHWTSNIELHMWTDASNVGYGAYYHGEWFFEAYESVELAESCISARELYAVAKAIATWGHGLSGRRVLIHSDNKAVVDVMRSGYSRNSMMMCILRSMFYLCANNNMECSAVHVAGSKNIYADLLSRNKIETFQRMLPDVNKHMALPGHVSLTNYE